jgi:hypothetical protein
LDRHPCPAKNSRPAENFRIDLDYVGMHDKFIVHNLELLFNRYSHRPAILVPHL